MDQEKIQKECELKFHEFDAVINSDILDIIKTYIKNGGKPHVC